MVKKTLGADTANTEQEIVVGDPEELRPRELPLVVKPAEGKEWANPEQAEFAKTLNGYAYKNPTKWKAKKAKLLEQLVAIGNDPSLLRVLAPRGSNLSFKNKIIEQ